MNVKDCELKYDVVALKIMCEKHGLQTTGNKRRLCLRLINAAALKGKIVAQYTKVEDLLFKLINRYSVTEQQEVPAVDLIEAVKTGSLFAGYKDEAISIITQVDDLGASHWEVAHIADLANYINQCESERRGVS